MKRRYKILLIIIIGIIITFIINFSVQDNKLSLVSLGDGFSLGMISYNTDGVSYNDYLKDYLDNKNKLKSYNSEFSKELYDIENLYNDLENNTLSVKTKTPLKQIISKANILTIGIGMDEIMDYHIKNKLNEERINNYLNYYSKLIKDIRTFYDKDLIILSLYPSFNIDKNIIYKINKNLESIAVLNKCKYIDITAIGLNKENYLDNTTYYLNYKGNKEIYNIIRKVIKI